MCNHSGNLLLFASNVIASTCRNVKRKKKEEKIIKLSLDKQRGLEDAGWRVVESNSTFTTPKKEKSFYRMTKK